MVKVRVTKNYSQLISIRPPSFVVCMILVLVLVADAGSFPVAAAAGYQRIKSTCHSEAPLERTYDLMTIYK